MMNAPAMDRTFAGRIGVARRDITPPPGIHSRNWGAATHTAAEGIHRPLTATVLSIRAGESPPLILVAIDLGWFKSPSTEWILRGEVLNGLSIDSSRVMICLSHTHAGPSLFLDECDEAGGALIEPYIRGLGPLILDAAREATHQAKPAFLDWKYGLCDLATNRDMRDPIDPDKFVVGFNPSIPSDSTLLVGRITCRESLRTIATIVNYACHPTTLAWDNRLISPDYVGAMRQTVETETQAPCLFLQGASGDLAPAAQYVGDTTVADRNGAMLGYAVLATLSGMRPAGQSLHFDRVVESGARLGVWTDHPSQIDSTVEAIEARIALATKPQPSPAEISEKLARCTDPAMRERLRRQMQLVQFMGKGAACEMPLWAWRIGNALLFGHPNEAYSQWQIALRQRWPDHFVAAINLVNGSGGYLVPGEKCHPHLYSSWQSPFLPEAYSIFQNQSMTTGDALVGSKKPSADQRPSGTHS
ncbi:MAG: hypothetical protein IT447_04950 [Phycisphaerales bacterium]|jgi:hypothetical protein|nr:hypothetical protein [Phycisphaerales bacterium]